MSQTVCLTSVRWGPRAHLLTRMSHPVLYANPIAEGRKCECVATSKGSFRLGHPTSCATQEAPSLAQWLSNLHRQHNSPAGFTPVQVAGPSDSEYVQLVLCWAEFQGQVYKCHTQSDSAHRE